MKIRQNILDAAFETIQAAPDLTSETGIRKAIANGLTAAFAEATRDGQVMDEASYVFQRAEDRDFASAMRAAVSFIAFGETPS